MSGKYLTVRLGDYCMKIGSGATPKGGAEVYNDTGDIFFIRSQNIYNDGFKEDGLVFISDAAADKLKNVIVEKNDVLLNITGDSVARVCLADEKYLPARVNQHVAIIRPDPNEFDPRYLRYFLCSPSMQNHLHTISGSGGTRNALTKGMLESLEVVKPPLLIQKNIADHLEVFDKKIEVNDQTCKILEEIARLLFKSWFIDFEPVKCKNEMIKSGASISEANVAVMSVLSGMSSDELLQLKQKNPVFYKELFSLAELFPSQLNKSKDGNIPKGWKSLPVKDFGKIICGKTPSKTKPEYFGQDIPFIKIPDMHHSMFAISTNESLSTTGAESQLNKMIPRGSICVSCIATVGKVIITHKVSQTNQQINSIVPNEDYYLYYLYFYMLYLNNTFQNLASGGSATLNMNTSTFSNVNILAPDDIILRAYSKKIEPLIDKIESSLIQNITLKNIKYLLLPQLLLEDSEVEE